MFSNAFRTRNSIGWFMAHGINYGVYLELANDRQNAAIVKIVKELLPEYKKGLKKIYGSTGTFKTTKGFGSTGERG